MVEWAVTDDQVCGFGNRGSVSLRTDGWRAYGRPPSLPGPADAIAVGTTAGIGLPCRPVVAKSTATVQAGPLDDCVHRFHLHTSLDTQLAFEGPASVELAAGNDADGVVWIRFPEETAIAVGFREQSSQRPTVTVPPTPAGLASAVTAAGRTHRTTGPERSHPGFRPPTPTVRLDRAATPDSTADGEATTTVSVPDSALAVLVAAPLAYYLGAEMRIEDGPPRIRGPGIDRTFPPVADLDGAVAEALRHLCVLDSELRVLPGESPGSLEGVAADVRNRSPAERLVAALEWSPDRLPEWPLSTYVDDDPGAGRYLPYLLDRLSLVHPADASELDPQALLKRSLDEFFRGESPNVEAVDPELADSRYHAWLGGGTPVDAYSLVGGGEPTSSASGGLTVDVICNDREMRDESEVADRYRERLADHGAEVRVHERLSRAELAAVFERPTDLVHFIGHCEIDGLVCSDGVLSATDLDRCDAEAFFLNACGSYYEGHELVRQGATVGAVTLSRVLDEQAVTLGTAFADLLSTGFAFERALSLARGEIIVGRDYAVVGDGTHRLRPPYGTACVLSVSRAPDGRYVVEYDATTPGGAGRECVDPFDGGRHLCGETVTVTVGPSRLQSVLSQLRCPVRYNGELRWSGTVAAEIAASRQQR